MNCKKCNTLIPLHGAYCPNCKEPVTDFVILQNGIQNSYADEQNFDYYQNDTSQPESETEIIIQPQQVTNDNSNKFLDKLERKIKKIIDILIKFFKSLTPIKICILITFAIVIIIGFSFIFNSIISFIDEMNGIISIDSEYNDYIDLEYSAAYRDIEKEGFTNIELLELNDLESSIDDKLVTEITIDGESEFYSGDKFSLDSKVVITYHTVLQLTSPLDASQTIGKNFEEIKNEFELAGFSDVRTVGLEDLKSDDINLYNVEEVTIDSSQNFNSEEMFPKDSVIKIYYHSPMQIEIPVSSEDMEFENYELYLDMFERAGFTNISTEKIEDLIIGFLVSDGEIEKVTVDGNDNFQKGESYPPDVEIVFYYHTFPGDDEEENTDENTEEAELLEEYFPQEMAKRAIIVAMTNHNAIDVFSEDGNTRDPSKFHSYSDKSDYYITIYEDGVWEAVNDYTWYVEDLVLELHGYTFLKVSLEIAYDEIFYYIENGTLTIANLENINSSDPNKISVEELINNANNPQLTVSPDLIVEDRIEEFDDIEDESIDEVPESIPDDSTSSGSESGFSHYEWNSWVNSQFSIWDGSHNDFEELIKDNLNDERSYSHIETTFIAISDENVKNDVLSILQGAGVNTTLEIYDVFIMCEFSAKNAFDATIKNTALGVVSYENNTITLITVL